MPNTFRRLNRRVLNPQTGEYEFQMISTVGVNETELDIMKGCTTSSDGVIGLVPAPSAGTNKRYLRCDGTWQEPTSDLPMSGTGTAGLMTPEQVTTLNNLNTTVSSLNTTVSSLNTSVKNLSSTVSTHTQAINKNKSDIQSLDDDLSNRVSDYTNKINQVNNTVNSHRQTHINDINNLQAQINNLVTFVNESNGSLAGSINNNTAMIQELNKVVSNIQQQINAYHGVGGS